MKIFLRKKSSHFKRLVLLLPKAFVAAVHDVNVSEQFSGAAGSTSSGGGASWHDPNKNGVIGGAPQGMQGSDGALNTILKGMRASSASFRQEQGASGMRYQIK